MMRPNETKALTVSRFTIGKVHQGMQEGLKHGFLIVMLLFAFFPFVFMLYTSLKS